MTQRKQRNQHKQTPNQTALSGSDSVKRFSDHIGELRRRTFFVALVFLAASGLAYNYHDTLVSLIMQPLQGEKLIYLTPGGGFNFIFQISLYAGLLAAAPVLIYQLYGFIKPALPQKAHRSATAVVATAFFLMLCGVAFGYFVAIPSALHFLSTFAGADITPNLTADSYLSFFLAYIAGLGVLFELPLLLLFLHWIHPLTPGGLLKSERIVIVLAFVIAAIITPTPDAFNQAMIAVPLIAIYQGGVIVVWLAIRRERRRETRREMEPVPVPVPEPVPVAATPPAAKLSSPAPVFQPAMPPQSRRPVSVDGFRPASRRTVAIPPRANVTPPPPAPRSTPSSRPRLSVDGFYIPKLDT